MRKHFLILMLFALLPFTAWADDLNEDITGYHAVLTIGANNPVYDGTDQMGDINKIVLKKEGADDINISFARVTLTNWKNSANQSVSEIIGAGTYTCTVSISTTSGGPITGTVTVEKKMVNFTADGATITYLDAVPTEFAVASALDQFEDVDKEDTDDDGNPDALKDGVMSGDITFSTNYTPGSHATDLTHTYFIRPIVTGLTSANYRFGYIDGVLTVNPMSIVDVTPGATANTPAEGFTFTVTNPEYNGHDANANPVVKLNGNALTPKSATDANDYSITYHLPDGTDPTTPAAAEAGDGNYTAAGNYFVKVTGSGNYTGTLYKSFTVNKKAVVITTKNAEKTYDGKKETFATASYVVFSNLLAGDKDPGTGLPVGGAYADGKSLADIKVKAQVNGADKDAQNWVDGGYDLVAYSATANNAVFKNYTIVYFNGGKYTINKKALTFTAKPQSKTQGTTHALEAAAGVTPTATGTALTNDKHYSIYLTIDGLIAEQAYVATTTDGTKDEIATYPTLKVTIDAANKTWDATTSTWYYPIVVDKSKVAITNTFKPKETGTAATNTKAANNYEITGINGKFTVDAGTIQVMIQPVSVVYGQEETVVYDLFLNGASAADKTAIINAIKADEDAFEVAETAQDGVTKYPNVATYDLDLNISDELKAQYDGLYTFDVIPSTYEITKATVNITLNAQSLNAGNTVAALKSNAHTVEFSGLQHGDSEEALYKDIQFAFTGDVTGATYMDGGALKEAAADYQASATAAKGYFAGAITLDPATEFDNYKFNLEDVTKGDLFVSIAATLALDAEAEDDNLVDAIAAANTKKQNVKFAARTLTKETWNVMVLPFATSVREVSNAFGYAVVDLIDQTKGDENHVYFSIHMGEIPANTPFMVKTDETVDLSTLKNNPADPTALVAFLGKTIEAPAADYDGVGGAAGTKFVGVYALTSISGAKQWWLNKAGTNWGYYTSGKAKDIAPTYAYLQLADSADPNAARIFIEEPNGTTTVIKGINAEGQAVAAEGWYTLDGIKLNAAPTQKGIYINNGKKVVLK